MEQVPKWVWWVAGGALVLLLVLRRGSAGTTSSGANTGLQQAAIQADAANQAASTAAKADVLKTYITSFTNLLGVQSTNAAALASNEAQAAAATAAANAQANTAAANNRTSTTNAIIGGVSSIGSALIGKIGGGYHPPSFGGFNGSYASTTMGFH